MSADAAVAAHRGLQSETSAESLGAEITELCSYLYAAEYRLLKLIGEFDARECWASLGLCSCAHWLNLRCGIGMNAAREKVRVARALKSLPGISAAFEQGRLSYSKVRAMTRVADETNEAYLLMIAENGTAYHVETLVSKYRRARRLQDSGMARQAQASRSLSYRHDEDGCLVIEARLPAEQGALVLKALAQAMEETPRGGRSAEAAGARSTSDVAAADVSAETPAGRSGPEPVSEPDPEPVTARRADALVEVAESYLSNAGTSGSTADRYQVVLHVTAETSELEHGPPVAAETSRRIACDSAVVPLLEDRGGEPLSIGRKSRTIPPAIRRALKSRDQRCRFPGCTRRRRLDGHHVRHWADGGETGLDNLVLLCRHHHRLVHEGGFVCERSEDGSFVFRGPDRERLEAAPALPGLPDRDALERWFDREFFEAGIDGETCVPTLRSGETIDWHLAASHMFPR